MMLGFCSLNSVVLVGSQSKEEHSNLKNSAQEQSQEVVVTERKQLLTDNAVAEWIDDCHKDCHPTLLRFRVMRARNQQEQAEEAARAKALRNVGASVD